MICNVHKESVERLIVRSKIIKYADIAKVILIQSFLSVPRTWERELLYTVQLTECSPTTGEIRD